MAEQRHCGCQYACNKYQGSGNAPAKTGVRRMSL